MCRCEEALELISRQLDETLTPEETERLAEHLASCEACRTLALELRDLHKAMAGFSEPVPDGFADSVMARVRQEPGSRGHAEQAHRRGFTKNWRVWGGLAAAVVLVAAVSGRIHLTGMGISGSTAAAPDTSIQTADAASDEQAYDQTEKNAAAGEAGDSEVKRSFSMAAPAPAPEASLATSDIICGYVTDTVDGTLLTAEEAGYLVLEAAAQENISTYESTVQDESITLTATMDNGEQYTLRYTGPDEDGGRYLYTLTLPDGTEQSWFASTDGSETGPNG